MENKVQSTGFRDSYIDFMAAMLNCEVSAMKSENKQREIQGDSMADTSESFYNIAERYQELYKNYVKRLMEMK